MQNRFGDDITFEEKYHFKEHGSDMTKQFTACEFKKNFWDLGRTILQIREIYCVKDHSFDVI